MNRLYTIGITLYYIFNTSLVSKSNGNGRVGIIYSFAISYYSLTIDISDCVILTFDAKLEKRLGLFKKKEKFLNKNGLFSKKVGKNRKKSLILYIALLCPHDPNTQEKVTRGTDP